MESRDHAHLTPDEQAQMLQLARRQHEEEALEARVLARWASRAALVRHIWILIAAVVLATIYVITIKADIAENARQINELRDEAREREQRVRHLEIEIRDKVNR